MLTDILWPAAVVLFEAIIFFTTVMLVRFAAHEHEREQMEDMQLESALASKAPAVSLTSAPPHAA